MPRNERHIVPNSGKGGWDSVNPATGRRSHFPTQGDAARGAKNDLARHGGGEAITHGRDGRIRDSDTVSPGNDPSPPRDKRH